MKVPPISGGRKKLPAMVQTVIISLVSEEEQIKAEELKKKVMGLIYPCKDRICIRGVRKRGDGKLEVEAATDSYLKKIVEHEKLKEGGLTATRSGALNPKIVLFDVPRRIEANELAVNIFNQNVALLKNWREKEEEVVRRQRFCQGCIPRYKIGKREGHLTNWVLEVSPEIRNLLRSNDKIGFFLYWQFCKV